MVDVPRNSNITGMCIYMYEYDYVASKELIDYQMSMDLQVSSSRNLLLTAEVLESLNIANGTNRVLFRTLNTDR